MNALQLAAIFHEAYGRVVPDEACPFRPASPDGQLALKVCAEVLKKLPCQPLGILRTLNSIIHLGDLVYEVRENEGQGWDGPKVKAWGEACAKMEELL
jgi:hypothetical protein